MSNPTAGARLPNRIALVTGAASGIGQATATLLAHEGARVALADIDTEGTARTAESITAARGIAHSFRLDITAENDWEAILQAIHARWGPLDILVNSAGIAAACPVAEMSLAEWRRVLAINLDGIFLGTRAGIRSMRTHNKGSIVNVASASGIKASPGASAYCASKAAVLMFSRAAALECLHNQDNIRINCVAPGAVKTPMWMKMPNWAETEKSEMWQASREVVPSKRFATPEEIARAILYLASDESSFVTATELIVDGGYTA